MRRICGKTFRVAVHETQDLIRTVFFDTRHDIHQHERGGHGFGLRADGLQRRESAHREEAATAVAAYNPARQRPQHATGLMKNLRATPAGRLRWHWDPKMLEELRADDLESSQSLLNRCRHFLPAWRLERDSEIGWSGSAAT